MCQKISKKLLSHTSHCVTCVRWHVWQKKTCFWHLLHRFLTQQNSYNHKATNTIKNDPANIYLFKVNNRNTWKRCEICSKLTIKTPEQRQRCRNFNCCKIYSSILIYKCWYNTDIHKNKKEQFKSKKSLNEIHLTFDVNKTHRYLKIKKT